MNRFGVGEGAVRRTFERGTNVQKNCRRNCAVLGALLKGTEGGRHWGLVSVLSQGCRDTRSHFYFRDMTWGTEGSEEKDLGPETS